MAIQDKDQPTGQTQAAPSTSMGDAMSTARNGGGQQQAQASRAQAPQQFRFSELAHTTNAPMGRNPQAEVLTKLHKAMTTVFETINKGYEVTLIPVDMANNVALMVSVLVVAIRDISNPDVGVAFHTLLLEGSTGPIRPRFEQIQGTNVEIIRTVADAYDKPMYDAVIEAVSRNFPQSRPIHADAEVVPTGFDVVNEQKVYVLAANAAYACVTELRKNTKGFQDLNLANASNDETLTIRPMFAQAQKLNAVDQPVRTDIQIDLSAVSKEQQSAFNQGLERVSPVTRLSGFMDLVWDPVAQAVQNIYAMPAQQQPQQKYAARFVMTEMEAIPTLTPAAQLVALVTSLALRENNSWSQAFKPVAFGTNDIDMRDIGAIGIEMNFDNQPSGFGTRVDTKSASFTPELLHRLIGSSIRPGLIVSLDVPECGPSTWYNGLFAAAGENNDRARLAIVEAANVLTNGAFGNHFPANGRICTDEANRIHLGHYVDRNGEVRDLRDIDYLAVLNVLAEKDPTIARDWSDTFNRTDYPLALRLTARKRIIEGILPNVVFTGFARRVTFEALFLDALANGVKDCGLDVRSVMPYTDAASYERATAQFAGSTLMAPVSTGVFNRGGAYGQGQGAAMGASRQFSNNRWY